MDLQKIIENVVAKLKADPNLVKNFLSDPAKLVKDLLGIDIDAAQIEKVVEGVKGQIDIPDAGGILNKLKRLFGK